MESTNNTDPVGCRRAPSMRAAWKQELCSSTAVNGPATRITALKPVLNNVYTNGVAGLKQNGPCKVYTHTSRGCLAMQQLDNVCWWCHDTASLINPYKAQTLWCTLNNRAVSKCILDNRAVGKCTLDNRAVGKCTLDKGAVGKCTLDNRAVGKCTLDNRTV